MIIKTNCIFIGFEIIDLSSEYMVIKVFFCLRK
jgi:hypothetical protein